MDRNLPCTVLRFLFSWYKDQELAVRWNSIIFRKRLVLQMVFASSFFGIDELYSILRLSRLGVGCHLGYQSVGALGYADDIHVALLAPSPSHLARRSRV